MSRNNRIQQPYGYREQNSLTTESAMICNAITGGSASSKEIIEKINYILYNGFFGVSYDKGLDSYTFTNSLGNLIGAAKLEDIVVNQLIQEIGYNQDEKKIFIKLENDETIEIPLDTLVNQVNSLVEDEAILRKEEDDKIWDAIGEIGTSGSSIVEMIENEISARTKGDEDLWEALNQEVSARTDGDSVIDERLEEEVSARTDEDQKIWGAIGEIGASGSSIIELINNEVSARTDEDQKIWGAIGEIGVSGTSIVEMIENEISARTDEDQKIWDALSAETEARKNEDILNTNKIEEEVSARTDEDQKIWDAIGEIGASGSSIIELINNEVSARTEGDEDILETLNQEISARTEGDAAINEELDQEKLDRSAADGELEGKIDTEKTEREAADNELDGKIAAEKNARLYWDNQLSGDVKTEKTEREAEDKAIWAALSAETEAREVADEALSSSIEANKVSVIKVETALPSNVKEAYELKNTSGEVLGARINIYKDSSLKDVELTDHDDSGHTGQFLMLTYILEDGTEKVEYLDVSQFLVDAEFKDGLVVNNAGEVRVKIDPATETYISVSQNGVKVSGIDAIAQNLANEIANRGNADTRLETLITTESTARLNADNDLNNAITAETAARESADSEFNVKLSNEKAERAENDRTLSTLINTEINNRTSADQTLNRTLTQVSTDLANEISSRSSGDSNLQEQVNALKTADTEIKSNISNVEDSLANEINNRAQAEADLQLQINKKANSVDVYYKTEVDSTFATKSEIPIDFYSKAEVDEKDNAIKQQLNAEAATREAEDVRLNNAITAETSSREAADTALQNNIDALETQLNSKLVEVKAKDTSISVDNTNATKPEIKVNISTEVDQIVKLNADGIYAKSILDYDEEHNILIYTNTTGTTTIALKTKSEIDRIYYDKPNERIVIEYTVNGTRKEDVYVPVHDLIQEWRTEDGNIGAIALTKDVIVPDADVLKARLILNTAHGDNAAIIDDNSLYVSKNAIVSGVTEEINTLKARVATLEAALQLATQENTRQSQRIIQVEQKNASQDDQITEINTKNQSQDESIQDLINYINVNTEP